MPPGTPIPRDSDAVILPGTKSTLGDLRFLREQGWDHDIIAHARAGRKVIGLCGGYQILGRRIRDLHGVEGPPEEADGLGLLDVETEMLTDKTVRPLSGECLDNRKPVVGYEIHMGKTTGADTQRRYIRTADGEDGAVSADGNVVGCYVHGLFWSDSFRAAWLNRLRQGVTSELLYFESVGRRWMNWLKIWSALLTLMLCWQMPTGLEPVRLSPEYSSDICEIPLKQGRKETLKC